MPSPPRVLVCGGRSFSHASLLFSTLDTLLADLGPFSCLISGSARGADELGEVWARMRSIPLLTFPAQWQLHGSSAGPIRNLRMLAEGKPNLVVGFPGGRGTAHMVQIAQRAGVNTILVPFPIQSPNPIPNLA